jgi:hypothetical protein
MKFRFHKIYALLFVVLLIIEILIVLYAKDEMLRGFVGDILVVGLIYCFILMLFDINKKKTIIGIGVFALLVEISQAFHLVEKLGFQDNKIISTIMGTNFDFNDIWAYAAGCALIWILEFYDEKPTKRRRKLF